MPNTYDLAGKCALVTGGAKGIGRSIVTRLAAGGAKVWVWDLHPVDIDGVTSDVVDVTQAVASMIADSPMNRLGLADEVAHLVAWLCTEASRYNTGAVFDMSGGRARY